MTEPPEDVTSIPTIDSVDGSLVAMWDDGTILRVRPNGDVELDGDRMPTAAEVAAVVELLIAGDLRDAARTVVRWGSNL